MMELAPCVFSRDNACLQMDRPNMEAAEPSLRSCTTSVCPSEVRAAHPAAGRRESAARRRYRPPGYRRAADRRAADHPELLMRWSAQSTPAGGETLLLVIPQLGGVGCHFFGPAPGFLAVNFAVPTFPTFGVGAECAGLAELPARRCGTQPVREREALHAPRRKGQRQRQRWP